MKHINYSKKIGTFIVSLALTTMLATSIWAAGYSIKGNLSVNVHSLYKCIKTIKKIQ